MQNSKPISKGYFLWFSIIALLILMTLVTALWYFISPRLHEFNPTFPFLLLSALRVFFLLLIIGTILVLLTSIFETNFLVANLAVKLFIVIVYPLVLLLSKIVRFPKAKIMESFVSVNDSLVKALNARFKSKDVIILLPHCLQNTSCALRITVNPNNCKRCGKCTIGAILSLAEEYNVQVFIATGGTIARRIIRQTRPKLIIAVACYRDLVTGIQDVFPLKTIGILNLRPHGPCVDTSVHVGDIRDALRKFIKP